MRHIVFIFCIIIFSIELNGQAVVEILSGKVSFVSSQNVYVKFTSTAGISTGDTLYNISSGGKLIPVLKVNNLSSVSCVCTSVSSVILSVSDPVIARKKIRNADPEEKTVKNVIKEIPGVLLADSSKKYSNPNALKQKITGSISAYSYSDFSNTTAANSTHFRYTFSIDARNIAKSKFSIENYMSFNHKPGEWNVVRNNVFNALKIYNLAVNYDLNKTTRISLGRKINSKISSIGAMDGLQVEKSFNKFALGVVAGFRPDFINYGFDSKLFQYGAYLSYSSVTADKYNESSLAFMQQNNSGKTDRRFLCFQHSDTFVNNVYFFSTFEVDLYKLKSDSLNNNIPQNTFNLTGLYLSLRYKMFKNFSITGSYDGRKNVMYYETYKTFIDRILESEMRQSIRLKADYHITNNLTLGLQSGYRFLKSDPHPSKNLYGYLMYNQIPGLNISITLSGTYLESNYLNSKILGGNISRDFFHGKLYTEIGYRYVGYTFPESLLNTIQNIGDVNISWQFSRQMSLSVNYEGTFEKQNMYNRLFLQIRKRF